MAAIQHFQGLIGIGLTLLLAWVLSEDRAAPPGWRWIGGALLLQLSIGLVFTRVPEVWALAGYANKAVAAIERATLTLFPAHFASSPGPMPPCACSPSFNAAWRPGTSSDECGLIR